MPNKLDNMQKGVLWGIRGVFGKGLQSSVTPYCGHEAAEEQLEGKLWEYAEGSLSGDEAERFREQVYGCKYCLQKLLGIQRAINQTSREPGYSLAQVKKLLEGEKTVNVLQIALNWIKDSMELIATTGLVLPLEPVPATRSAAAAPPKIIKVAKKFEKGRVEVWAEPSVSRNCNIELRVIPPQFQPLQENPRVNLTAAHRLLASCSVTENRVNFEELPPGNYRIELMDITGVWGHILLDIA